MIGLHIQPIETEDLQKELNNDSTLKSGHDKIIILRLNNFYWIKINSMLQENRTRILYFFKSLKFDL